MNTPHASEALIDMSLYRKIVQHRKMLTKISWVDYSKHNPSTICFIPPARAIKDWESDYEKMRESMFYGETIPFVQLIRDLTVLQKKINGICYDDSP